MNAELKKIVAEVKPTLKAETPDVILEAIATQILTAREARKALDRDGLMVRDAKHNPVAHPALDAERAAQNQLTALMKPWLAKVSARRTPPKRRART
ncbi:hypothetical protein Pan216_30300 [Planctomycetes bacterium Pan216]|uniref:Phage terminase, small subunit n=1 Tax=Kolteria novifilia TaxID=2527975 RepID=A0A518B5A4_9BACT|nr:hypothetical protein Pan216_30300 [Planctomycetes bacterium Pan216]